MTRYADIASKRILRFLKWLGNHRDVEVAEGGNHPTRVTCLNSGESYPLPTGHAYVNKHIVKHFMEWLVKNGVCTEQEFDERL